MAWVIYFGMQELHTDSESWLAEWGRVLGLANAMSAIEQGEAANLVTLMPQEGEIEACGSLEQWLRKHPTTHCTLVYPQPALVIAQQLQQGAEMDAACQQWKQQAQALVSLFRQHRRQLSLWTWPVVAHTPEDSAPDQIPLPEYSADHEIEPIYTLLALQALAQDAELTEATRYLAASTHNAAQCQVAGPGLGALLEWHRQEQQQQSRDQQTQADALQAKEEENALLLEQLHGVQEELEQVLLNRHGLENQLDEAKSAQGELEQRLKQTQGQLKAEQGKRASLEQERDKVSTQCKESEEENTLLLEQLHFVQEELERHILDHRDQERRYTEQQQAHQHQELLLQWLQAFAARTSCALYKKHRTMLKKHKALLDSSASFDADWYVRTYPDVAESGIEPAIHYLKFGMLEGRNPSADFDTVYYITAHPDVAAAGEHPLLHYIRWGRHEQRQAMPQPFAEESR